ncbi:phosphohistidine phosphatase [Klebsiella pneumoniae]|nr:phosphohistidine phosphatase [Klebsiella pneumoniae]MBG1869164.1 phosphohistidine phosphatase [Klebsiella pneumoniae]
MDGLWEKISSYNIFNNLFPGALFIYLFERSTNIILSTDDVVKNVVLYYFTGLIIGRVGSIVFEPILKFIGVVKFIPYGEYISACQKDSKIEVLQETANMYRTLFSMSLVFFASLFFVSFVIGGDYIASKLISFFLIVVFIVSYVKQIKFIISRVNRANGKLP